MPFSRKVAKNFWSSPNPAHWHCQAMGDVDWLSDHPDVLALSPFPGMPSSHAQKHQMAAVSPQEPFLLSHSPVGDVHSSISEAAFFIPVACRQLEQRKLSSAKGLKDKCFHLLSHACETLSSLYSLANSPAGQSQRAGKQGRQHSLPPEGKTLEWDPNHEAMAMWRSLTLCEMLMFIEACGKIPGE